jgi:hypothetical protein
MQQGESQWSLPKRLGLDVQVVEVDGLEQNTSYVYEAFVIESNITQTLSAKIRHGSFRTLECNANSITPHQNIFVINAIT